MHGLRMDPSPQVGVDERCEPVRLEGFPHRSKLGEDQREEDFGRERRQCRSEATVVQVDELVERSRRFRVARVDPATCEFTIELSHWMHKSGQESTHP